MNLLSWNVRGLLSSRRRLRRIIRREHINFVSIIEPWLDADQLDRFVREFHYSGGFASSETKIWLLWSDSFDIEVVLDSDQFVLCKACYISWGFSFDFIAIYAKHTRTERALLWSQLAACLTDSWPVLLGGDYNVISRISEYRGTAIPAVGCISDFSDFIADNELLDLATLGSQYTWHGVRTAGAVWKRLDRYLMNANFRDYFTEVRITVMARTTSDYSPILLSGANTMVSCLKQFRFQNMWITHPSFMDTVSLNWNQPAEGWGMRALAFKLKRLKQGLRSWNRDIFGNVFYRIRDLEIKTTEAENAFDEEPLPVNRELLHKLRADLLQALKHEELYWKQKALVKWLKDGDSNSRYFHSVVKNMHRRGQLRIGAPFTVPPNESDRCRHRSSNPTGLTCWDLVKEDVFAAALDFFSGVPLPRAMASAQIVLLPKKDNPGTFADFRPICLCTFVSKIFTRIITSRLSSILPKIISKEQAGFVEDRSIQDNVLLAFELLQHINKRCRGANVAVKLDMMKAFDRVSWPFLRAVLGRFGFPAAFINPVLGNLEATRLSVLVNGALSDILKHYQTGSGQKINYSKSFFVTSKHYSTERLSTMSRILSMQHSSLPFRYLGVNMFAGRNRTHYYYHLLEKSRQHASCLATKVAISGRKITSN
ncbi:PREDICTED: uncharacterized protein LOC109178660 [Ipomoea nil]|uniref:uncharacterized protein LOC109178660 n=1 Tax=Ipomoea nil TaxID=35883 RepID=UPI0009008657|nr:PREDICTED: uncharacterized protein LOC109178660 [Ipomoea nil]